MSPSAWNPPQSEPEAASKALLEELAQWERFALNRLDQAETRPFEVKALPDELAFEVSAGLLFARDKEAVKSVFRAARARGCRSCYGTEEYKVRETNLALSLQCFDRSRVSADRYVPIYALVFASVAMANLPAQW